AIRILVLHHEVAQALPGRAGYLSRVRQLEQEHLVAVEVAKPLLTEHRQFEPPQPVARKQHASGIGQKPLLTMDQRPAAAPRGVEYRRLPAQAHQAATGMPSARTLSLARSSTLARELSRRSSAPPSR